MIFGYIVEWTFRRAGALHALEPRDLSAALASFIRFDRCGYTPLVQRPATFAAAFCAARANSMIRDAKIIGEALPSDEPSCSVWKPADLAPVKCVEFQTHRDGLTGKQPESHRHTEAIAVLTQPTLFYRSQSPPSRYRESSNRISVNQATYNRSWSRTPTAYRSCTIVHPRVLIELGNGVKLEEEGGRYYSSVDTRQIA